MCDRARDLARQFIDAMNRHDAAAVVEQCAEDVLFWEPSYDEPRRGRDALRRDLEGFFAMLPDIRLTLETAFGEHDVAVSEWSYHATYGSRPIALRECAISRVDDAGRIREIRVYFDRLSLLRQLGIAPDL
jgi:steroid delta-isomerase-like uncharacterized protein